MLSKEIAIKNKIASELVYTIKPFNKDKRKTQPHKHNQYLEIVYLQTGSGFHWIDEKMYTIISPVIFLIKSNQVHHWDINIEPSGYVIILKDIFPHFTDDNTLKLLIKKIYTGNCFKIDSFHETEINQLFQLLLNSASKYLDYKPIIIDGLLKALLGLIAPITHSADDENNKYIELYQRFVDLLFSHFNEFQLISEFANALDVSAQRLNTACNKTVNLSCGKIIDEFIMNNAKQLLLFTTLSISDIAIRLKFNGTSYFIRFFKKYQKVTPDNFRKDHFLFANYQ